MRAVVYCRVSTKEQTQNLSLPTQRRACEDYCRREGIEVARVFMERGESAKTANRPELQEMLAYCRQHKKQLQFVVVYNLSRFSRESGAHHALRGLFAGMGIALRSVTEPIDESPTGRLMESVIASIAQFDNDVKAERTRVGMRTALEAGRWTFQAPLGYRTGARGGPSLIPDPDQAALVREAFEAFDSGRHTIATLRERLRRRGLATRHRRPLAAQTLRTLLRNPIYCGRVEVPNWRISVAGDFDGIVPGALFARVQARLDGRASVPTARTRNHPDFPLRRFVRCGECNRPLTGSWSKGRGAKYAYYHCPAAAQCESGSTTWRPAKAIDKRSYDRQRDRLREQLALAEMEAADAAGKDMDVAGVLAFAETALADAVRLWDHAPLDQRQRLQTVFFPEGITFDGSKFGTAVTCLAFAQLPASESAENGLASPTGFEAPDRVEPSSQPVDQTRKDNDLAEGSDDGNRQE